LDNVYNMVPGKVIYTSVSRKFVKRIQQHLGLIWMPVAFVIFIGVSLDWHESFSVIIIIFYSALCLLYPIYDAYSKSIHQVTNICTLDYGFKFHVLNKNIPEEFDVSVNAINSKLRWLNYNRHTIELTVFDGESILFKQYSNGSRESEYELENIVFQIKEAINTN
jgi:hypothetical protein